MQAFRFSVRVSAVAVVGLGTLMVASCAHHRDVRAGAGGVHKVVVRSPDEGSAERSAISQAEHFCKEQGKYAAFIEEKTQYTGEMDEGTRKTVRNASRAAQVLGSVGAGAGSGRTRTGGTVLGGAGTVGAIMTGGDDYVAEMRFKCE